MTPQSQFARVVLLMAAVAGLLGWTAGNSAILFADGLRYIDQAKRIDGGDTANALFKAIDHPAYPLAIAGAHRLVGGSGPEAWQIAAQVASVAAAVLLVIPLYLVALEMFGVSAAWLAVVLSYLVPMTGHVMADTLSESLFLLLFTWGVWTSLKFLKQGSFWWLPPTIGFAAMSYWVRPEGVMLPVTMVGTLVMIPMLRATRMRWTRWWAAVAFLMIGPACLIAPIVAMKGGISTKPAVSRVLGTGPMSPAMAVERQRPMEADQTLAQTYVQATRAMAMSVRDAVTIPLLPLALLGLILAWPPGNRSRQWVFYGLMMILWTMALIRLYATGGYCTPRHTMILAYPLISAAAFGMTQVLSKAVIPGRWLGRPDGGRYSAGPIVWALAFVGLVGYYRADLTAPINERFAGYRGAANYLAKWVPEGSPVVDVTGWALYYGQRPGYTFGNLVDARKNTDIRCLVVRDAHRDGPWTYCQEIRTLIGNRKPVATYPEHPVGKQSLVYVYDWSEQALTRAASSDRR